MQAFYAYAIFDTKALVYNPPYFAITDAAAARAFGDLANDLNTHVGRHPADYILYAVGSFNDANGTLEPISPRRHVADAISLVVRPSPGSLFEGQPEENLSELDKLKLEQLRKSLQGVK